MNHKRTALRAIEPIDDDSDHPLRWRELLRSLAALNRAAPTDLALRLADITSVFSPSETRALALLLPELERLIADAVCTQCTYESLVLGSALKSDVLNQLSFGVVIASRCAGIQFANRAAEEIAAERDGLRMCPGGLGADHPEDNTVLMDAQNNAFASRADGTPNGKVSSLSIRRHSLRRPYIVDVAPLSVRALAPERVLPDEQPAILLTISDSGATSAPALDLLIKTYRLTQTEAALALKIAKGYSLKSSADHLGIAEQTARWHLKKVLTKTGARRQSELVRLLMVMTPPHRRHSKAESA